ncbi:MAG: DNA mismatch repair protein MutS [Rhodospirillales bacterium]|nr:DNA mismatch repair protein MutS [Rhodospirillales bacterium]
MDNTYSGDAKSPPKRVSALSPAVPSALRKSGIALPFKSILSPADRHEETCVSPLSPDVARDLNLDQIIAAITAGHEALDLQPLFYAPLRDVDHIAYRHEVMRDLENAAIMARIHAFLALMRRVRATLARSEKLYYPRQKARVFVDAVLLYVDEIGSFARDLAALPLKARGLRGLAAYVSAHAESVAIRRLREESDKVKALLSEVSYAVFIKGDTVSVRAYDGEADYSEQIAATFARFSRDAVKDYRVAFHDDLALNSVEERILDRVARLFPAPFVHLERFATEHQAFIDPVIDRFFREIHFYVLYQEYIAPLRKAGLPFCYPAVSTLHKHAFARDTFDLALATKLIRDKIMVVTNTVFLRGRERVFVVSGPNQGGKTTFVRTFGQLHHFAAIGCLVPGRKARLFLPDCIYTHFEREETVVSLRGKLQDDLLRAHDILAAATPASLILMNEIFSSTTLADAVFLASQVMRRIISLDCLAVCVTFMDELATLDPKVVSMTSMVRPEDPATRTLKVIRRPADGRAYAFSIAEKYRLTRVWIDQRLDR